MSGREVESCLPLPLPLRRGSRPLTSATIPHQQLDQQPTESRWGEKLARAVFAFPTTLEQPSGISVPGARALTAQAPRGPAEAFLVGSEFAHLHPEPDLSLHLTLPTPVAEQAIDSGWAEWHPWVSEGRLSPTVVMVYAPRDCEETEIVTDLVRRSWRFATVG